MNENLIIENLKNAQIKEKSELFKGLQEWYRLHFYRRGKTEKFKAKLLLPIKEIRHRYKGIYPINLKLLGSARVNWLSAE